MVGKIKSGNYNFSLKEPDLFLSPPKEDWVKLYIDGANKGNQELIRADGQMWDRMWRFTVASPQERVL